MLVNIKDIMLFVLLIIMNKEIYYNGIILVFDENNNYVGCYSNCFDEHTTEYIASIIKEILIERDELDVRLQKVK